MAEEWEYKEFIFSPSYGSYLLDPRTIPGESEEKFFELVDEAFWGVVKDVILPEVQRFLDEGWELEAELGPSGINSKAYKGTGLIQLWDFRVNMRRRKT